MFKNYSQKWPQRPVVKRAITNHAALNEAYDYGSAFSRGMRIDLNGLTILLISGTASIDDAGRTVHVGDFRAQLRRTFDNITELLAAEGAPGTTSCAPPATCATSSATTRPSTKSAPRSSKSRDSIRCRRPRASRQFSAALICWSKSKRLPCSGEKSPTE